jgi:hypothetical protein
MTISTIFSIIAIIELPQIVYAEKEIAEEEIAEEESEEEDEE